MSTSSETAQKPACAPDPTASLNCVKADLAGAVVAHTELDALAQAGDTKLGLAADAPKGLLKAQKDAEPHLRTAAATKARLDAEMKCKLTDDDVKKLDECSDGNPPKDCCCDTFKVPRFCLCGCVSDEAKETGAATGPTTEAVDVTALQQCFDAETARVDRLVKVPENLAKEAEAISKRLTDLEAQLAPNAADPIPPERAYLVLKLEIEPELALLEGWATITAWAYAQALKAAIQNWLCLGHKRVCALADQARQRKDDELEKQRLDDEAAKGPIEKALDCFHKDPCSGDGDGSQGNPSQTGPERSEPAPVDKDPKAGGAAASA